MSEKTFEPTHQVQGSPVKTSARKTLAKCITAAPNACFDVSKNLEDKSLVVLGVKLACIIENLLII